MELIGFSHQKGPAFFLVRELSRERPRGLGLFAFRLNARSPLVLEVPHPKLDRQTDLQGSELFLALEPVAFLIPTVRRCASRVSSPCSGVTTICSRDGRRAPYPMTDAAHSPRTYFEEAHEALLDSNELLIAIQLHTFNQNVRDAHAYLSDGTELIGGPENRANRLTRLLRAGLAPRMVPNRLPRSCNEPNGRARFCGTTSVQGRYANGSPNPCTTDPQRSSGRFIRIEQSRELVSHHRPELTAALEALCAG
jgi:hypothetical protein